MFRRVIHSFVDAKNDRHILTVGGSGNYYLFNISTQVLRGILGLGKSAGRFDHYLGTDGLPRNGARVLFGKNLEFIVIDPDRALTGLDTVVEIAHYRIVL